MADLRMYHNPGCKHSRGALELLTERDADVEVIEYLEDPLSREDLEAVLDMLVDPPADLVRKDKHFESLGLDESDYQSRDEVLEVLLEHPVLMQRPILIRNGRALIGRPLTEELLATLD